MCGTPLCLRILKQIYNAHLRAARKHLDSLRTHLKRCGEEKEELIARARWVYMFVTVLFEQDPHCMQI